MERYIFDENKPLTISHDRMGIHVHVKTKESVLAIKNKLSHCQEYENVIYMPSEISPDAKGYSFYIRKRRSLKDYILEKGLSFDDFKSIIEALIGLIDISFKLDIDFYDFIYDYSCIFIGKDLKLAEFVYAPRERASNKEGEPIKELLTLLSLHLLEDESQEERACLTKLLDLVSSWEKNREEVFPAEEIISLMEIKTRDQKKRPVKPFLYYLLFSALILFYIFFFMALKEKGIFVVIGWLLITVSFAYLLFAKKTNLKLKRKRLFVAYGFLGRRFFFFDNETINIGRDKVWADINVENLFVSRKHASISFKANECYIEDLDSKNGIFLNGERLIPGKKMLIKRLSLIELADRRVKLRYFF